MLANASDVSKCKVNFFPIINVQILKKNEEKQEKSISTLSKQEKKETRLITGRASIYSKKLTLQKNPRPVNLCQVKNFHT